LARRILQVVALLQGGGARGKNSKSGDKPAQKILTREVPVEIKADKMARKAV